VEVRPFELISLTSIVTIPANSGAAVEFELLVAPSVVEFLLALIAFYASSPSIVKVTSQKPFFIVQSTFPSCLIISTRLFLVTFRSRPNMFYVSSCTSSRAKGSAKKKVNETVSPKKTE